MTPEELDELANKMWASLNEFAPIQASVKSDLFETMLLLGRLFVEKY